MFSPSKRHILVVDDDENVREVFSVMLREKDTRWLPRKISTPFSSSKAW